MKAGFYPKLALDGIRKNGKLYKPYILTCIGMVMMYYIMMFLQTSELLLYMPGSGTLMSTLNMGSWIIAVFAAIFLFYTNSFLIRRRKMEFGLYHILGMGKRNIARILLWEALIIAGASLLAGILAGIVLSKLAELGLVNIIHGDVSFSLSISAKSILRTVEVFAVIDVLLFINALMHVSLSSSIELLRSENTGEKPPKANWVFGMLGAAILAAAYYLAVTVTDPVSTIMWFFVAVIMVIVATYLIFIAGSVVFCRILQKNKNYYYKANHFVSVSSMVYRMKRNGAGLASICILAIMVLVMISSTTSLYFGSEDSLRTRYPRQLNVELAMKTTDDLSTQNIAEIRSRLKSVYESYGAEPENAIIYRHASAPALIRSGILDFDDKSINQFNASTMSDIYEVNFVPLADYNEMAGTEETLESGEVLIYTYRTDFPGESLTVGDRTFQVKKRLNSFAVNGNAAMDILPTAFVVLPNFEADIQAMFGAIDNSAEYSGIVLGWTFGFDTDLTDTEQTALGDKLRETLRELDIQDSLGIYSYSQESRAQNRADYYGTFGSLFFLGIVLSIIFIFAAVLIIYYKQISEGYEDQARFEIMQNVGMTKQEIRRSINSQLLTVFFLPLAGAALHLAFAFPMIRNMLQLFNRNNVRLFAVTTLISFLVFALFYTVVYRKTSNAYYKIVSGGREP